MLKKNKKICFIVPVYNEERTIERVVKRLKKIGSVIAINDCSIDNTNYKLIKSKTILINHTKNRGYTTSLFSGFKKAIKMKFKYAITFDGDGQHYTRDAIKILNYLKKDYIIVYGKRKKNQRFMESVLSKFTNFFYKIKDPLCGLKGYNLKYSKKLDLLNPENLVGTRMIINAKKKKYKIKECKISLKKRKDKPRFGGILSGNLKIFFLFLNIILIETKNIFSGKKYL